jgi:hypothetical protein
MEQNADLFSDPRGPATGPGLIVEREDFNAGRGPSSPWGSVQTRVIRTIGEDSVEEVSTAGHGGIHIPAKLNIIIPAPFRVPGGWYEEDCGWAAPVHFLPAFWADEDAARTAAGKRSLRAEACACLMTWQWQAWEAYTGAPMMEGISFLRDEAKAAEAHKAAGDWAGFSAVYSQEHEGFTLVWLRNPNGDEIRVEMPAATYARREGTWYGTPEEVSGFPIIERKPRA